jgi:ribonuclease HII
VREALSGRIATLARSGIGLATVEEIDRLGIVPALSLAARRAYHALGERVDLLLLDRGLTLGKGKDACDLPPERSFTRGDASSLHIACASILAKVSRDRAMDLLDGRFPGYGLQKNKGYGTPSHLDALARLGPSPIHRATFRIAERAREGTLIDSG